jgi:hypothetical protein
MEAGLPRAQGHCPENNGNQNTTCQSPSETPFPVRDQTDAITCLTKIQYAFLFWERQTAADKGRR